MPDFTQRMETADGCFDVSFKANSTAAESGEYLVTVVEDDYAAPPFAMTLTDGGWKIFDAAQVSTWLRQLEGTLQTVIAENSTG